MTTRRGILKLVGGGFVVAAAAGGTWYALNGASEEARAAWREAGAPDEKRRRLLSYALLAPNPHNRQPWLVELKGEDEIVLYCDLDRRLPATDPFDRQITLGCGAFLELLSLAAAAEGYRADITPFPEGEPEVRLDKRPVAHVRLVAQGAQPDPAFAHIVKRTTNRNTYDARIPPAPLLAELEAAGSIKGLQLVATSDPATVAKLRDHVFRAFARESSIPATHHESVNLMRIGKAEVERYRDGIVLEGQMMEALKLFGVLNKEAMLDPASQANQQALDMYRTKAESAQAFAWLSSAGNTRSTQLDAGRAYARFTLKAAEHGLAVHPWSHSLQEFPEMRDLYDEAHAMLGAGRTLQMLVRVGYASPVTPAPRRGLAAHLAE